MPSRLDDATPLHIAAKYNCVDAAKLLLKYDADVMAKLTNGQTPIHICCRKCHMDIVKVCDTLYNYEWEIKVVQ